ncbi:hypothetical protein [Listeria booriae]|uniref:Uncharacterized protein n=1 Tax=Listeria booriae TaxID=1552123 RepID=A0A841ZUE6_9LIST|nr:hypothetical protein [Listeria booriae]MBC1565065.1 hypothetical protein [Listeria booriae]
MNKKSWRKMWEMTLLVFVKLLLVLVTIVKIVFKVVVWLLTVSVSLVKIMFILTSSTVGVRKHRYI